jgi:hypothetical protein
VCLCIISTSSPSSWLRGVPCWRCTVRVGVWLCGCLPGGRSCVSGSRRRRRRWRRCASRGARRLRSSRPPLGHVLPPRSAAAASPAARLSLACQALRTPLLVAPALPCVVWAHICWSANRWLLPNSPLGSMPATTASRGWPRRVRLTEAAGWWRCLLLCCAVMATGAHQVAAVQAQCGLALRTAADVVLHPAPCAPRPLRTHSVCAVWSHADQRHD